MSTTSDYFFFHVNKARNNNLRGRFLLTFKEVYDFLQNNKEIVSSFSCVICRIWSKLRLLCCQKNEVNEIAIAMNILTHFGSKFLLP